MPDRSPDTLSLAEERFADWLVRREGDGGSQDLESLCREHPKEAAELRRLWVYWEGLRSVLEKAGFTHGPRSLADKIQEKYGSGVDPNVSLDAGEGAQPPSDALLRRLAQHTLKTSRYRLHGEIARGGMGAILKVFDEDLRRNLAMKVILGKAEESASGGTPPVDKRLLARFLEEAQITGQLDHPGIVPVHELGLDSEGRVYFTMKLVKGRDLKQILELVFEEHEGWNETRALGVILKVCEAMAYAHKKGVIHRDLKPANVMVGNFGEVYVMDWGLARVEGREDRHDVRLQVEGTPLTSLKTERREEREEAPDSPLFTMDGDVVGTPAYMSPEQARGEVEKLSARSDVYALGAMLYHLLAGHMPYVPPGARISNRTVLGLVIQGPPRPLADLRRDVPPELVAIVDRAMARLPEHRYADTLELADDLRAYLEHRVVKAYETGAIAQLRKWVGRNRGLATASAAAVLALVAGIATSLGYASRAEDAADRAGALARSEAYARKEAQANATEASRLKDEAIAREAEATARAGALWAIEELKRFWTLDDDLEYARSQDRPVFVWWLEQAHELVEGRPADPGRGLRKKPSLQDHQRLLGRIRGEARELAEVDREREWWEQHLSELVHDLEELQYRIVLAERSLKSPETEWDEAIDEITRSEKYRGLRITPQLELVPLGPDPESGLWEFAHVPTGEPAVRGSDGKLTLRPETGVVFVLLPSGRVPVEDHVPSTPLNAVELDAFFLSKYEMTVEQWVRTSRWRGLIDEGPLLPANGVSWHDCVETLERAGLFLRLPTEAQWEYGCRAGTTTPWWTGATHDRGSWAEGLVDFINSEKIGIQPVGRLAANPFGLHDVHGNVWEWCQDEYAEDYRTPVRPGDGEREARGAHQRAVRDGSGISTPYSRASGSRDGYPPELRVDYLGLRVARSLTP